MFNQNEFMNDLKADFSKTIDAYSSEISVYRTGKASPILLDGITVDYYGVKTPLNQTASITVPDARLLLVQPFDRSIIKDIEKAILNADLGFNPMNDGVAIKVPVPALNEERRKEIVKQLSKLTEKYKIGLRSTRRDALDEIKKAEKEKEITEDEKKKLSDKIQKMLDEYIVKLNKLYSEKEKQILDS